MANILKKFTKIMNANVNTDITRVLMMGVSMCWTKRKGF